MEKFKKRIPGIFFFIFLIAVAGAAILLPDKAVSKTERRTLAKFPAFTAASFSDGTYMSQLETYLLEQFPMRDAFRTVKAETETKLFGKADADGYFKLGDGIYKLEANLNEKNIKRVANGIETLAQNEFSQANCYYAIIPDKNYFLGEQKMYPLLDYDQLNEIMNETVISAQYINLYDKLELSDYYRTDLHWKQECILGVADEIVAQMQERKNGLSITRQEQEAGQTKTEQKQTQQPKEKQTMSEQGKTVEGWQLATDKFIGAYGAASALLTEPDTIFYYNNSTMQNLQVYDYEKKQNVSVYAPEKIGGTDDYDFYLWGARALLTIKNEQSSSGKKLLIFRDSFGSSIAPLLAEYYEEVTLVDLRYVSASYALELLQDTEYDDVLFLYSTSVLNHSDSLRF